MSTRYTGNALAVDYAVHRYGEYTVIDGGKSQTFTPKYLTDFQISYGFGDYGRIKIGANNLFNVIPDENRVEKWLRREESRLSHFQKMKHE